MTMGSSGSGRLPDGTLHLPSIGGLIVALLVLLLASPVSVLEAVEPLGLLAFLRLCGNRSQGKLLASINGTLHSQTRPLPSPQSRRCSEAVSSMA